MIKPFEHHPKQARTSARWTVNFTIRKYLTVPPKMVTDHLASYYLLYWDYEYFNSQIQEGTIKHQDATYQIIYYDMPHKLKNLGQVRLSFRKTLPEYKLLNYVMVSGV